MFLSRGYFVGQSSAGADDFVKVGRMPGKEAVLFCKKEPKNFYL
jgi:hypothetical protein